jgi:tetratricopeptide (TPR) repeat protein
MAGLLEDAKQHASRAFEISRSQKEQGYKAYALRLLGKIAAHGDTPDVEQAETYFYQALECAKELGMRPLQAHCHLDLGTLYSKNGRCVEARVELTTAVEMYQDMKMTFWLPRAEAMLAES